MKWVLILMMSGPEGATSFEAGLMVDQGTCQLAGGAMALVLEYQFEGLQVGWSCEPTEEA